MLKINVLLKQLYSNLGRILLAIIFLILFLLFRLDGVNYLKLTESGSVVLLRMQDFVSLYMGILIEAIPFVVVGVVVSVLVALFFQEKWILSIMPKNRIASHIFISFFGIFMPVCECGNIPVLRRLIAKGFNLSHAITFFLAAPILNPVTIWSTFEAFNFDHTVGYARIIAAFIIAVTIGIILSYIKNPKDYLTEDFVELCEHDHHHEHGPLVKRAVGIFRREFIEVFKMMLLGAAIAAVTQTFIPREVVTSIGSNPIFSILAMILMAFIISICSNVDAFFALGYIHSFNLGSILSFLIFGPMIDIKILSMLSSTFKVKLIVIIVSLVTLFSILSALVFNLLY